jgi:peptidyl-prolyl cis-trans isomerase B (cyclophilin B)
MIQGGDPNGNGTGGSGNNIVGEFSANGYENNIEHVKGVISMARAQDPDSASSQFFIMVEDSPYLDGQYAAFGHVTSGQEIVDKIAADAQPLDDNGTIAPEDQPIITTIRIID